MISVVTWKWRKAGYHSEFTAEHVNTLRAMVARHYTDPHRFICITDDPEGIDPRVEVVPIGERFADLQNPTFAEGPSCYRRLFSFSREFEKIAGPRFVSLDLDVVITGDLRPLWNRPEEFVIHRAGSGPQIYNGSMYLMATGSRSRVWEHFDPEISPQLTDLDGLKGSDQAWIQYVLGPNEATWDDWHGVYSYRYCKNTLAGRLPSDARIVMFWGKPKPWEVHHEWVRRNYADEMKPEAPKIPNLFNDLILTHPGKRIAVLGGAPSLRSDLEKVEADVWISANDHGVAARPCDYIIAMDSEHVRGGVNHGPLLGHLRKFSDAPIIGPWFFNDYLLTWWPGCPGKMLSGLIGIWCAWTMGGNPVIACGFDNYGDQPKSRAKTTTVAEYIKGNVRQVSGMDRYWPRYDPDEAFGEYVPHTSIRGLLGIDEMITIEVRKPVMVRGAEFPKGSVLKVARHEVRKQLKHRLVMEV